MNYRQYTITKKGFTILELMVVIGILSTIVLLLSQPLASIIKYQRESQISDNMRDNLQFVINKMEKELRTSSDVTTADGSNIISFKDQNDTITSYKLSGTEIIRNDSKLTDNTVFKVTNLKFWNNPNTNLVTVLISAESLDGKDTTVMQTSVYPLNNTREISI
jgi:prepilin-type N-terminal cleavage/methylation domain-containing protein